MSSIQIEIESAKDTGQSLREVYAQLRSQAVFTERTALLRQADELAGTLGGALRRIASLSSEDSLDEPTQDSLRALGEMIEQVMVEEREYRVASGACSEAEMSPERTAEVVQ